MDLSGPGIDVKLKEEEELDIHTLPKKMITHVLLCHFYNFNGSWFILVFKLKPCSNTIITFVCFKRKNEYEKSLKKSHCWGTLLVKVMIMVGRLSCDVMDFCKKTCNVSFKWPFSPLSDCSCNKPLLWHVTKTIWYVPFPLFLCFQFQISTNLGHLEQ